MVKKLDPQKHADQRTRLLAEARHLFAVQGVKETSMSQVAGACKVTKATLYHYFQNKGAILKEMVDCRTKGIEAAQRWSKAQSLTECLSQIAQSHLEQMTEPENLELMKVMITEMHKNADMRSFYMEFLEENVGRGAQAVAQFLRVKKSEKELRLLFFQFMATLVHYDWNVKMVGDPSGFIGDETLFVKQLVKTYTLAFQAE